MHITSQTVREYLTSSPIRLTWPSTYDHQHPHNHGQHNILLTSDLVWHSQARSIFESRAWSWDSGRWESAIVACCSCIYFVVLVGGQLRRHPRTDPPPSSVTEQRHLRKAVVRFDAELTWRHLGGVEQRTRSPVVRKSAHHGL